MTSDTTDGATRLGEIERQYSAGPNDWDQIAGYIEEMYRYDPMNTVRLDADIAMILLECRKALAATTTAADAHGGRAGA